MIRKRPKSLIYQDLADGIKAIREGRKPKRQCNKDGSISTKPVIPVPNKPESEVLRECLIWLRKHGCVADRCNTGAGIFSESGYKTYGIIGGGDIVGILPNGVHFEIECKNSKGGRLSLEQQRRAKKVRGNKGIYLIIHGLLELEYYMPELCLDLRGLKC